MTGFLLSWFVLEKRNLLTFTLNTCCLDQLLVRILSVLDTCYSLQKSFLSGVSAKGCAAGGVSPDGCDEGAGAAGRRSSGGRSPVPLVSAAHPSPEPQEARSIRLPAQCQSRPVRRSRYLFASGRPNDLPVSVPVSFS